jgi:small-conductance mechanosensitive channel
LAFAWLARSLKAERQSGTNIAARRYLYYALYGTSFASALALLANVFGFVTLSQLVRQTVVWSGFVGTATIVTVYSISSLVSALIHATRLGSLAALRLHGSIIEIWLWRVIGAAGLCFWLAVTLDQLGIRDETVALLRRVLTARLPVPTLNFSIGDLLVFGAILVVGYLVAAGLRLTLCDDFLPRFRLERGIPELISAAVYYLLLVLVFLMAVSAAGMNLDRFAIITGAVGVGVGFGLQNVVNNFASGLILQFERPIHVGDTLDVGGVTGIVSRIGVRSSTIRTAQGAEVIIPNATLVSGQVTNWTLHHTYRRAEIPVRVAYGSDPARVKQLLLDQVERNPRVLKNPPTDAVFKGFGESALEFELQFWADQSVLGTVRSEIGIEIHSALREAGIEIPFPQREVHVRGMNVEEVAPAADGKEWSEKAIGRPSTGSTG